MSIAKPIVEIPYESRSLDGRMFEEMFHIGPSKRRHLWNVDKVVPVYKVGNKKVCKLIDADAYMESLKVNAE